MEIHLTDSHGRRKLRDYHLIRPIKSDSGWTFEMDCALPEDPKLYIALAFALHKCARCLVAESIKLFSPDIRDLGIFVIGGEYVNPN